MPLVSIGSLMPASCTTLFSEIQVSSSQIFPCLTAMSPKENMRHGDSNLVSDFFFFVGVFSTLPCIWQSIPICPIMDQVRTLDLTFLGSSWDLCSFHFKDRVSLHIPGCLRTLCVDWADLEFTEIHLPLLLEWSAGIKSVGHWARHGHGLLFRKDCSWIPLFLLVDLPRAPILPPFPF